MIKRFNICDKFVLTKVIYMKIVNNTMQNNKKDDLFSIKYYFGTEKNIFGSILKGAENPQGIILPSRKLSITRRQIKRRFDGFLLNIYGNSWVGRGAEAEVYLTPKGVIQIPWPTYSLPQTPLDPCIILQSFEGEEGLIALI